MRNSIYRKIYNTKLKRDNALYFFKGILYFCKLQINIDMNILLFYYINFIM